MDINIELENANKLNDINKIISDIKDLIKEDQNAIIEGNAFDDAVNDIIKKVRAGIVDDIVNPFKKVYNDAVATARSGVETVIKETKEGLEGIMKDIKKAFEKAAKDIEKWFKDISADIVKGFNEVTEFFRKVGERFEKMGKGLEEIFGGIGTEFTELGDGLRLGFTNIGVLFKWVGEFVFSYITCGVQYVQNLHRCIFFYSLDAVLNLAYMPIRLLLWVISTLTNRDEAYKMEQMIWDKIYEGDAIVYKYTGVHYAHYPKNIRDLCYNCKRMRATALKNKVQQINYIFDQEIPKKLQKGVGEMQRGGDKFKGAFL